VAGENLQETRRENGEAGSQKAGRQAGWADSWAALCITPVGADQAARKAGIRGSREVGRALVDGIKCGSMQGAPVGSQEGQRQGGRLMGRCVGEGEGRWKGRQTGKRQAGGKIGRRGCQSPAASAQAQWRVHST
jgi:hypothetical protein